MVICCISVRVRLVTKGPGTAFARVLSWEAVSAMWAEAAEHEVAAGYSPADVMELTVR